MTTRAHEVDLKSIAILGGIGIALYALFKYILPAAQAVSGAVSAATGAATTGIANAIVWATSGSPVAPTGNVILPNGAAVAIASIPGGVSWDNNNNVAMFSYGGNDYQMVPNPSGGPAYDTSGNYHAEAYGTYFGS